MTQRSGRGIFQRISRTLFVRLLTTWEENRRAVLLVVIAIGLSSFISSLPDEVRRTLTTGLLEQHLLVALLLLFLLTTLSLLISAGQRLDTAIFLLFNLRGYHPLWMDRVMWAATQVGNGVVGILLGVFLYFSGNRRLAVMLLLGIMTLWMAVELIKAIVERTRPFMAMEGTRVIGWRERGLSFPSGHTSQAFFMAALLTQYLDFGPLLSGITYFVAFLVGFTRIYVGAHYPRDVIGGGILGSVWGILINLIEAYLTTGQL